MPTKVIALLLGFLSFFAFWSPNAQPNSIPETRSYVGEVPDKYGVWPTEGFEEGPMPWWFVPPVAKAAYPFQRFINGNVFSDSVLVLHRGKLAYEYYADGWDKDTRHQMYSVTKSIVSALVGVAIGEGKIQGVGQKVADFYPDADIAPGQESKRDMTIEHLLTHTSGLPGDGDRESMDYDWWDAPDSGVAAFGHPQLAAPGEVFSYSSGAGMQALACLVSRAVGRNLFEYAKEKLFAPLGMDSVRWDAAADGNTYGGFGLSMTPRDMLRFGYLYLNQGRWEDRQIIPADFVALTPPRSKAAQAYGYLFWNTSLLPFDNSYEASGSFGQFIAVMPEWDAVIVRTGSIGPVTKFVYTQTPDDLFEQFLLPVIAMKGVPWKYFREAL
ncbi:MAG: beta-lactamase family protein [Oscillospiraceae bacterium]|jgi:CubicO group peptidase (beta-lactamase class C family)|nr:beta-lactamase family protein [Oscillospiraceae bacterium]